MSSSPYDPAAVDALIDERKRLKQELSNLRTQQRNAENLMAAIVGQYGVEGELRISKRALISAPREFTFTWHEPHDDQANYLLKICE